MVDNSSWNGTSDSDGSSGKGATPNSGSPYGSSGSPYGSSGSPYGSSGSPYGPSSSPYGSNSPSGGPTPSSPSPASPTQSGSPYGSGATGGFPAAASSYTAPAASTAPSYSAAVGAPSAVNPASNSLFSFISVAIAFIILALNVYITPIFLSSTGDNPEASHDFLKTLHTFLNKPLYVPLTILTSELFLIAFLVCFLSWKYIPIFCSDIGRALASAATMILISGYCVFAADRNPFVHPHLGYSLLTFLALAAAAFVVRERDTDPRIWVRLVGWFLEIVLFGIALFIHQYNL